MRKSRSLFLIILVVLFIAALADFGRNGEAVVDGFFQSLNQDQGPARQVPGPGMPHQSVTRTLTQDASGLNGLTVTNPRGQIEIRPAQGTGIEVEYTITIYADREDQAEEYLSRVDVRPDEINGRLFLTLDEPPIREPQIRDITVDYSVAVPRGLAVDVNNQMGVIAAADLQNDLTVRGQNIRIERLTGDLDLNVHSGSVRIEGVDGDATVNGRFHPAHIRDVTGDLDISNIQGEVIVDTVGGDLEAHNLGDLFVTETEGNVTVETTHGTFDLRNARGRVTVRGELSSIRLDDVRGDLQVLSRRGNVLLDLPPGGPGYEISARVTNGDVITALPLNVENVNPLEKRAAGTVGAGGHQAELEVENGSIILRSR